MFLGPSCLVVVMYLCLGCSLAPTNGFPGGERLFVRSKSFQDHFKTISHLHRPGSADSSVSIYERQAGCRGQLWIQSLEDHVRIDDNAHGFRCSCGRYYHFRHHFAQARPHNQGSIDVETATEGLLNLRLHRHTTVTIMDG